MTFVQFRPAAAQDARSIRALILQVRINPVGLDWRRFLVAVDEANTVIGCGQIKPHRDGTQELASIAVLPGHQRRGIGREIIRRLLLNQSGPLYLTCRAPLEPFYRQFGFRSVSPEALPPYFRQIKRVHRFLRLIFPKMDELLVMIREA